MIARLNRIVVEIKAIKRKSDMLKAKGALQKDIMVYAKQIKALRDEFKNIEEMISDKEVDLRHEIENRKSTIKEMNMALHYAKKELGYE